MKFKDKIKKYLPLVANNYAKDIHFNTLLNHSIGRTAANLNTRNIDLLVPLSWEFSGFSQNGEDGIIDFLLSQLTENNRYFVEIGSGNGLENNTSYLAHIKKYSGLHIEGDERYYHEALITKPWLVDCLNCFVNNDSVGNIMSKLLFKNPAVFSLDIDGIDYHIMKLLLEKDFLPKIIVAEYNSAFGPDQSLTIPYSNDFSMFNTEFPYLYYGVSITGWRNFLRKYNYEFITVESNGINAFFIQRDGINEGWLKSILKVPFKENVHQLRLFKKGHDEQFSFIKHLPFQEI